MIGQWPPPEPGVVSLRSSDAQTPCCGFGAFLGLADACLKTDKILRKGAATDVALATVPRKAAHELWDFFPLCHQYQGQKNGKLPNQAPSVSAVGLLIPIKNNFVLFCWYLGFISL